jgi:hypothetical protein
MKWSITALALLLLTNCQNPVQIQAAPNPTHEEVALRRDSQSRVLPIARTSVFPKVVDLLLDNGYLVRSVNYDLGVLSFYHQWPNPERGGYILQQEGTMVIAAEGPGSTRVRLAMSGRWEYTGANIDNYMLLNAAGAQTWVKQNTDASEYKKLLDILEKGLVSDGR